MTDDPYQDRADAARDEWVAEGEFEKLRNALVDGIAGLPEPLDKADVLRLVMAALDGHFHGESAPRVDWPTFTLPDGTVVEDRTLPRKA